MIVDETSTAAGTMSETAAGVVENSTNDDNNNHNNNNNNCAIRKDGLLEEGGGLEEIRDSEFDHAFRQTIVGPSSVMTTEGMIDQNSSNDKNSMKRMKDWFFNSFYLKVFFAWFTWIFCGTLVYAFRNDLGWARGFYMAVNVGYSIGWGFPIEKNYKVIWYSIFHVLAGASAVAAALGFFAQSVISTSKEWYHVALLEEQEKSVQGNSFKKLWLWSKRNWDSLKIILLWMIWIGSMTAYTCGRVGWVFTEGLYNAISSLSTGGLWAIPADSPDVDYFVIGLFSATGVPLMALAMSTLAQLCISFGDPDEAKKTIQSKVTQKELDMMKKFGLDDGDGFITRSEFILLCAVRIGAMDQELIKAINDRFCELDASGDGFLSYEELLENPSAYVFDDSRAEEGRCSVATGNARKRLSTFKRDDSSGLSHATALSEKPGIEGILL